MDAMAGVVVVHQRVRAELLAVWPTRVRNMKNERARFAVLPIEPNHTFNFKDLYLLNKNTYQLSNSQLFVDMLTHLSGMFYQK